MNRADLKASDIAGRPSYKISAESQKASLADKASSAQGKNQLLHAHPVNLEPTIISSRHRGHSGTSPKAMMPMVISVRGWRIGRSICFLIVFTGDDICNIRAIL